MKKGLKNWRRQKGITLIALVITIIVLLILAGISIATLTGDNGILTKAGIAKEETEKAKIKEEVQVEVLGSYDENGKFQMETLKENLKKNLGVEEIIKNEDGSISFLLDEYYVTVNEETDKTISVEVEGSSNSNVEGEMNVILASGSINNKKVLLTANITNKPIGLVKYDFYIDGELKSSQSTTKKSVTYEYTTSFGEVKAYVKVSTSQSSEKQSNEITIEDNSLQSLSELKKFKDNVNSGISYENKTITQIADIDMKEENQTSWTAIGTEDYPFKGTYDGQKHTMKNIYINDSDSNKHQGLFGYNEGKIQNLGIESGNISGQGDYIAGICAENNGGFIYRCYTNIDMDAIVSGGIAGICVMNYQGTISQCYNSGNIIATLTSDTDTGSGINATNNNGSITECYNTGNVTITTNNLNCRACGISNVAGKFPNSVIKSCYNTGIITLKSTNSTDKYPVASGICGQIYDPTEVAYCYNSGLITVEATSGNTETRRGAIMGYSDSYFNKEVNCYYLEGTSSKGIGQLIESRPDNTKQVTSDELTHLVASLGGAYIDNDDSTYNQGYPILKWQQGK